MYLLRHGCKGRRHALHQLGIACLNAMCQVVPEARCKHSIELSAALLQPLELPKQCERGGDGSRSCSSMSGCSCRHSHVRSRVARDSCHAECVCVPCARAVLDYSVLVGAVYTFLSLNARTCSCTNSTCSSRTKR